MIVRIRTQKIALAAAVLLAGLASSSAQARRSDPKLVNCAATPCLAIAGRRDSAASAVLVNGHAVEAKGGRTWRARVPLDTLRTWTQPYARSIEIAVIDARTGEAETTDAVLPVGLLGTTINLAELIVRVR